MKRIQLALDDRTYEALRRRALREACSMAALSRQLLSESLGTGKAPQRLALRDFSFVAAAASSQGETPPVSERHDDALAQR